MKKIVWMVLLASGLCGCMATTGNYRSLNQGSPARPPDCDIAVFKDQHPARPYVAISQLNVHLEKTFFVPSDFASAKGELRKQACLSGADGVIDIEEKYSSYLETRMYNLSATGIKFTDRGAAQ